MSTGHRALKPRALVIAPDFPPARGGIQILVDRVVRSWDRLDTLVIALDAPRSKEFDASFPFMVRRVSTSSSVGHRRKMTRFNWEALMAAHRFRPHVVLSGHIVTSPAAWAISCFLGVPYVQYLYGEEIAHRKGLAVFATANARAVISISDYTSGLVPAEGRRQEQWHLIPPGVDAPTGRRRCRESRPTILTVARLTDWYKGHDVMIRALGLIRTRVPDVQWVVVGDGPLRATYEEMVRASGHADIVRFEGELSDDSRNGWFDRAHVFAMPSRLAPNGGGEGFGIVYLEAASHELAVVAGSVGGALSAVVDGVTGMLVDPNSELAVSGAISDLLCDQAKAAAMGTAGAAHALEFEWHAISRRVQDVVLRIAATRPSDG